MNGYFRLVGNNFYNTRSTENNAKYLLRRRSVSWELIKGVKRTHFVQRVGCNLEIGSKASVDECGVCGGDGSSCSKDLYHWSKTGSGCSVSCGGGKCANSLVN